MLTMTEMMNRNMMRRFANSAGYALQRQVCSLYHSLVIVTSHAEPIFGCHLADNNMNRKIFRQFVASGVTEVRRQRPEPLILART